MSRSPDPGSEFDTRGGRTELRELAREEQREPLDRRWTAVAFVAGVAFALVIGFATDLFQTGPTRADVDGAYQRGAERGASVVESDWQDELVRRERIGFARGRSEASTLTADEIARFRYGFTYEAAYDLALQLAERGLIESWDAGWWTGYRTAWEQVRGAPPSGPVEDPP